MQASVVIYPQSSSLVGTIILRMLKQGSNNNSKKSSGLKNVRGFSVCSLASTVGFGGFAYINNVKFIMLKWLFLLV